jgi:putative Mg2+ transporter-C (MgtC) family protein
MNLLSIESLTSYWSAPEIAANITVLFNLLGALLLGMLIGYERSYHGRAAGMRTYGLVCVASAALTVIVGYSGFWYGGHAVFPANPDPTRVIQGIVTGVGFLGAGVIMHEGLSTHGLTTAASIWTSSAIGIMVGVGFYMAAIVAALLAIFCMTWINRVENWLPSRGAVSFTLQFRKGFAPHEGALRKFAADYGYEIADGTIAISCVDGKSEWQFVAVALSRRSGATLAALAAELSNVEGVETFHLSHARN